MYYYIITSIALDDEPSKGVVIGGESGDNVSAVPKVGDDGRRRVHVPLETFAAEAAVAV